MQEIVGIVCCRTDFREKWAQLRIEAEVLGVRRVEHCRRNRSLSHESRRHVPIAGDHSIGRAFMTRSEPGAEHVLRRTGMKFENKPRPGLAKSRFGAQLEEL